MNDGDPCCETSEFLAEETEERKVDASIVAALLGGTLLLTSIAAYQLFDSEFHGATLAALASILLGVPIVWDAVRSLLRIGGADGNGAHMEELVALAVLASFATGQYLECGSIAFFMLIASFIEDRQAVGARKTIESLIRLTPTQAHRLTSDGQEELVDAAALSPGDRLLIRPGDTVPADGTIVKGGSTLNQAPITGESLPVERAVDDEIFAGTLNVTGAIEIEVSRAGEDSTLGRVKELILQASRSRPTAVRMLDRYASFYTPVVVMVAAALLFFTRDIDRAISLLLIACPCAIILAGPTAVVASLAAAARLGVLVKTVSDLEIARRATAFVLDKTGTLTSGELTVSRMFPGDGVDGADLLALAAAAERGSKHPVAKAVVAMAERARVPIAEATDTEETAGCGVIATVEGTTVIVGRESWLKQQGVDTSSLDTSDAGAMSLLHVASREGACREGGHGAGEGEWKPLGWIGLADTIRPDAAEAMAELDALGVKRRVLVTGDRLEPAREVASQVHVTELKAEALPAEKLELVEHLKSQGHVVVVVGDGVNDGPALAAGHLSIAMGAAGSDVAIHSASIALMNNNLGRLPFLLRLSRRAANVMRQNIAGTGLYILGMLVGLGLGWVTPLGAAILHGVSSIVVVFNSARLVREGEDLDDGAAAPAVTARPAAPVGALQPA